MILSLEGLPGSGKTTSAALLAERLGVRAVYETTRNHPFLKTVYDERERNDLEVELAFLLLHSAAYRRLPRDELVVTDFSPVKDGLFAKAILSGEDFALFEAVYRQLYASQRRPAIVIVLDAGPELCLQRVKRRLATDRERTFEEALDIERLELLQRTYENHYDELGDQVLRIPIGEADSKADVVDRLLACLDGVLPDVA